MGRRMMMTSGGGVKYRGSVDCGVQILKNEGFMSLMKGAGANILRGFAGAGVLAGFDKSSRCTSPLELVSKKMPWLTFSVLCIEQIAFTSLTVVILFPRKYSAFLYL